MFLPYYVRLEDYLQSIRLQGILSNGLASTLPLGQLNNGLYPKRGLFLALMKKSKITLDELISFSKRYNDQTNTLAIFVLATSWLPYSRH